MLSLLCILLCSCIWAGMVLATKLLSGNVSAVLYALIRYGLVAALLAPLIFMRGELKAIQLRDLPGLLLSGFWLSLVYTLLFFAGVYHASVTTVAILSATSPVCMVILASFLGHSTPRALQYVGIIFCFLGAVLVVNEGAPTSTSCAHYHVGELLTLGAVFAQSLYRYALRKVSMHYSTLCVIFATSCTAALCSLPLSMNRDCIELISQIGLSSWILFAFISVASVISIQLFAYGLRHEGFAGAHILSYTTLPLFGVAFGYLAFGEMVSLWQSVGGLLIILSVILVYIPDDTVHIDSSF